MEVYDYVDDPDEYDLVYEPGEKDEIPELKDKTTKRIRRNVKMPTNKATQVTTGEVRLSYEHLLKPYTVDPKNEAKYSVTLLIPKTDYATKSRIDAAIQAAILEGVTNRWGGKRPPQPAIPLWDGDGVRLNGESFGEECKGHWVMTASSKQKQDIVDLQRQPILDATQIYSGMYALAAINFFAYDSNGKRGIGCGLGPIMKTRDGEPLGGRMTADDAFGAPDGYNVTAPQMSAYPAQPTYQAPQAAQAPRINPITGQPM
jgi:Protein of unknown function (DUF2815).